jgi:hypothetical protein
MDALRLGRGLPRAGQFMHLTLVSSEAQNTRAIHKESDDKLIRRASNEAAKE